MPKRRRRCGTFFSKKMNANFIYRSSWEQSYFQFLDESNDVVSFYVEPFKIPYLYRKRVKNYIPDVLIKLKDKVMLVEIKPKKHVLKKVNQAKFQAAKVSIKSLGIDEFIVLTEDDLRELGLFRKKSK